MTKISQYPHDVTRLQSNRRTASKASVELGGGPIPAKSSESVSESSLSPRQRIYESLMNELRRQENQREQRIQDLKNQIQSGQYRVDSRAVAERLRLDWQLEQDLYELGVL